MDDGTVSFTYTWELNGNPLVKPVTLFPLQCLQWRYLDMLCRADGTDVGTTIYLGHSWWICPRSNWCGLRAAAGADSDSSGSQYTGCLSEIGIVGEASTDGSSYTLQPGSIFCLFTGVIDDCLIFIVTITESCSRCTVATDAARSCLRQQQCCCLVHKALPFAFMMTRPVVQCSGMRHSLWH